MRIIFKIFLFFFGGGGEEPKHNYSLGCIPCSRVSGIENNNDKYYLLSQDFFEVHFKDIK